MGFGKLNIGQLRASTDSLLSKVVHVPDERGGYTAFTLFKKCRVSRDNNEKWFVEIDASDDALPLMFDFKNRYFKYELWNALRLKSSNQVRMYEILKQYESIGRRELTITELRELIGIAKNEYSGRTGWSDFKKYVLDSCQQALKETTDICYTYERGKVGQGGKWLTIIFHIKKNNDYVDQLTLDEFIEMQPKAELSIDEDNLEGQLTFDTLEAVKKSDECEDEDEKWVKIYGSERIAELAGACDYEFNRKQMERISCILTRIHIPKDRVTNSLEWGRVFYLQEKYAILNAEEDKKAHRGEKPISNRFKYLVGILEGDTFQPVAYTEE